MLRAMVELLGVLLALIIVLIGWQIWRALLWLRHRSGIWLAALARALGGTVRRGARSARGRRRGPLLRGLRLRTSRAFNHVQADRIAELTAELAATRRALRQAETRRHDPGPVEERFKRAKRAFALLFHPDKLTCREPERSLRAKLFQQYWQVLRQIEKS